jgi:hypothetical protein
MFYLERTISVSVVWATYRSTFSFNILMPCFYVTDLVKYLLYCFLHFAGDLRKFSITFQVILGDILSKKTPLSGRYLHSFENEDSLHFSMDMGAQ